MSFMKEFLNDLVKLPAGIEKRILRRAIRKGAVVFQQEIRKRIDDLDLPAEAKQRLKQAIVVRPIKRKEGVRFGVFLVRGPEDGERDKQDPKKRDAWWAHIVDRGTAERSHKTGHITGMVAPQPFLTPAIEAANDTASEVIAREMAEAWDQEVEKLMNEGKW